MFSSTGIIGEWLEDIVGYTSRALLPTSFFLNSTSDLESIRQSWQNTSVKIGGSFKIAAKSAFTLCLRPSGNFPFMNQVDASNKFY